MPDHSPAFFFYIYTKNDYEKRYRSRRIFPAIPRPR